MSPAPPDDLDPKEATTVEQFARLLRRLHVRAGRPSLRELEKWAEEQRAAGRRGVYLSRSGVSDALNGKRLPRKEFVGWFIEACAVPAEQRDGWLKAWERVADYHHVLNRPTDPTRRAARDMVPEPHDPSRMAASVDRIQPVFVELLIVTAFMKQRTVYRRVTERLVTAREDGVAYYRSRSYVGRPNSPTFSPVQALWGCTAESVDPLHPSWPASHLWFPAPLRAGESAYFASEVIDPRVGEERDWIDVHVDHHGIAQGQLAYGGLLPITGLTIRVRFEKGWLPEAAWWYARRNEIEPNGRPPDGDRHLLSVSGQDLQYTFTDGPCQSGETYGLAFSWGRPVDPRAV